MITLCDTKNCTGCGSCFNVCPKSSIRMLKNNEGFLYPSIDKDTCTECGLCRKRCPELTPIPKNDAPKVYASWSMEDDIRTTSSSGGLFFVLARRIIERDGVVYGVVFDKNMNAMHVCVETVSELKAMQGSKYVQSDTGRTYSEALGYLKAGRAVMFTGTPCQIAGFKAFLGKREFKNLTLVDIVCHGTPSAKVLKWYLKELKAKIGNFDETSFRFRNLHAWGYAPSVEISGERHLVTPDENLFMQMFLKSFLHRESCYQCRYATVNRCSDITLADFWGIGQDIPFNHDTSQGCSLLLVNSLRGEELLKEVQDQVFCEEREIEEALKVNHQLYMPCARPKRRTGICEYIYSHTYKRVDAKFIHTPYAKFRHFVGNILRTLKLR